MASKNFEIDFQDVLGYGNYGTVYGASSVSDASKHYAVKIFKSSDASAEEIEMMEYLSNYKFEYIANIEEAMVLNGRKAIVMERLDGGEVFERILNDGSFSEAKAVRCLVCLIKALLDLNKKAMVLHR
jgi:serine/threonine protein kinase